MKALPKIVFTMLSLVLGSCGSNNSAGNIDNGGGPGNSPDAAPVAAYSTGLDGSRTLSTLADTEKTSICTSGISYFSKSISRAEACELLAVMNTSGITFAGTVSDDGVQATCSSDEGSCMNGTPTSRSFYTSVCATKLACPGTVAAYETCVNDLAKALAAGMVGFPNCYDLTAANYKSVKDPSRLADSNGPASCQALDAECSGLTQAVLTSLYPAGR